MLVTKQLEKSDSARVEQPLNLNPSASLNLFKRACSSCKRALPCSFASFCSVVAFADLNSGRLLSIIRFFKLFRYRNFLMLFLFPCCLFAGKFDEHLGTSEDLQYIRTPEDRKLCGFFSALFDMAEKREKPAVGIPKTLHFIWLGPKPFPTDSKEKVKSWIDLHPGWKVKFWTDLGQEAPDDRMEVNSFEMFPLLELKDCYYRSDNFGERSEILRYAVLINEGGIYVDHDVLCLKAVDDLQESYDFFCGLDPLGPTVLSSSVNPSPHLMASVQQHPILKAAKKWMIAEWDRLELQYVGTDPSSVYNRVQHRSFRALGIGIREAHNRQGRKDAVFPPDFFSFREKGKAIFAVHQHKGSWHKLEAGPDGKEDRLIKEVKQESSRAFVLGLSLAAVNLGACAFLVFPRSQKKKRRKK